jgi:long-chain acyl-CoA synthetase
MGFLMGCSHVYVPQFTPAAAAAAIEHRRITIAHWVPTMIRMFTEWKEAARHDLSSLRMLFYGSSPMPVEWVRAVRDMFSGVALYHCYGLTETSPLLTVLDDASFRRAMESGDAALLKSAGRPLPGVEMHILDDEGAILGTGQAGEVVVRGPNVSKGYLNRDSENAQVFRDGWFHTGDVGFLDDDGYLYLVDRKKDMIITGGENVYSSEVEAVLYRHPGVSEAAVIGVPDDRYGEALFAIIVPKAGVTLTTEAIIEHCRAHIGGYKIPRRIALVDALPRTAVGKVQKGILREKYGASRPNTPTLR